ncbi:MAG TPA: NADH-quinone oxidoreductase subunit C [Nitrospiria bacterium]|nr:NADH-quinone oxidoreductase subunit C [Nitrospiria bacterium]
MHPTAQKIQQKFPEAFLSASEFRGDLSVQIKKEGLVEICRYLHDDPEMDFDYIVHISSVDWPQDEERFEMVYEFYSIRRRRRIRLKARVGEEDCSIDSVTGIWRGADFMEREVYDMMGIRFNNHPDLRRILMPDEYEEGYPLRKDFPLVGKGWRDTFEFLPSPTGEVKKD